jgi:hypothetical protein
MTTREQDAVAERLADQYGRAHVSGVYEDGSVVVTGMTDDIQRAQVRVAEDGTETVMCLPAPAAPKIQAIPSSRRTIVSLPAIVGYAIIADRAVTKHADAESAARRLLVLRERGTANVRMRAMTSLTQERELTVWEVERVLEVAREVAS